MLKAMLINAERVHQILSDCLHGEKQDDTVIVEGIMNTFGFSPEKLSEHSDEITEMLMNLPETFMKSSGGGHSFLMACNDKDGVQWGEHIDMDALFSLGSAINKTKSLFHRDMWDALPGSMPYYMVIDK